MVLHHSDGVGGVCAVKPASNLGIGGEGKGGKDVSVPEQANKRGALLGWVRYGVQDVEYGRDEQETEV